MSSQYSPRVSQELLESFDAWQYLDVDVSETSFPINLQSINLPVGAMGVSVTRIHRLADGSLLSESSSYIWDPRSQRWFSVD